MSSTTTELPTDATVCAVVEFRTKQHAGFLERLGPGGDLKDFGEGVGDFEPGASVEELSYLYGNNNRRAAAQLRRLVRAGLLRRVRAWPEKVTKTLEYALTLEGFALAVTARRPCTECLAPVEPRSPEWSHICRACMIDRYEGFANQAQRRAEWAAKEVEEAEWRAIEAREDLEALKGGDA